MKRRGLFVLGAALIAACDGDGITGPDVPSEVRNAPSTAVISGTPLGVTGFAHRTFAAGGAAVGETHWIARIVAPPGSSIPEFTAVELWYVWGMLGERVSIASAELVTDGTDSYYNIMGDEGEVNPGAQADIIVKLRDPAGNHFLIRTTNVPVQRSELLE